MVARKVESSLAFRVGKISKGTTIGKSGPWRNLYGSYCEGHLSRVGPGSKYGELASGEITSGSYGKSIVCRDGVIAFEKDLQIMCSLIRRDKIWRRIYDVRGMASRPSN